MKKILIAVFGLGVLSAVPARAQDAGEGFSYRARVENRFVYLSDEGRRGFVGEYDGRQYDFYEGAVDLWLGGPFAGVGPFTYFDGGVSGINSAEESARLDFGVGRAFRLKGGFHTITHFQPFARTGMMVNGFYQVNPRMNTASVNSVYPLASEFYFQRRFFDVGAEFRVPVDFIESVFFEYKRHNDVGKTIGFYSAGGTNANEAPVDRRTNDFTAGAVFEAGERSSVVYEMNYRDYRDYVFGPYVRTPAKAQVDFPVETSARHVVDVTNEVKFRCDAAKGWAFTGALVHSDRENLDSGYRLKGYTGAMSAMFSGIKDLRVTAKLYSRGVEVLDNHGFIDSTYGSLANREQLDKFLFRGELSARYRPLERVRLHGGYKVEYNLRGHAPNEVFWNNALYQDGLFHPVGTVENSVAGQNTVQRFSVGAGIELPFHAEFDAGYKRMITNRAAYESMPTWRDDVSVSLYVPLPMGFWADGMADFFGERNSKTNFTYSSAFGRTLTAAAGWSGKPGSVGASLSQERMKAHSEGYFGASNKITYMAGRAVTDLLHDPSMHFKTESNTAGANARANLPKGVTLTGSGSYTKSNVQTPVYLDSFRQNAPGVITDLTPKDIRIAQIRFGVEYAPESLKDLTVSAGYRNQHWVDKQDRYNSGRLDIGEFGVSLAF